jgi:hypothetical protein
VPDAGTQLHLNPEWAFTEAESATQGDSESPEDTFSPRDADSPGFGGQNDVSGPREARLHPSPPVDAWFWGFPDH